MYTEIRIQNFRRLRELAVTGLRRVNVFVGANNVGKTSLLEAAWLLQAPGAPRLTFNLAVFRGFDPTPATARLLWNPLFCDFSPGRPITLSGKDSAGITHSLTIRLEPVGVETITTGADSTMRIDQSHTADAAVPAVETLRYEYRVDGREPVVNTAVSYPDRFEFTSSAEITRPSSIMLSARRPIQLPALAERFTRVQDTQWFDALVQSLRVLEPDLTNLSLGYVEGRPLIRGHLSNQGPVPLPLLGGGVVRLTELLLSVLIADGGLTLVDEVENGLYYRSLETAWSAINSASAESRSQIFATTHSAECVLAALRAFADVRDEFRLYRLERTREQIRVVEYDYETAESSLVDLGLEVR
jgi:hypothetical protein